MRRYDTELAILDEVVRKAGTHVLQLSQEGYEITTKPDGSQVTTADLAVDQLLKERLLTEYPDDGWLSEETPDDSQRLEKNRTWILDPIDGTRNFIDKIPEYAISIGLVEETVPVLAMIFNPATSEMFTATKERGSRLNGQKIHVRTTGADRLTILANFSATQRAKIQELGLEVDHRSFGSIAYALAMTATGRNDVTLNPGFQNEWDIAAGVLLVQEAGGIVVDNHWQPIRFNQQNTSIPGVIATHSDRAAAIQDLVGAMAS